MRNDSCTQSADVLSDSNLLLLTKMSAPTDLDVSPQVRRHQFATKAVHAGYSPKDFNDRPVVPPLVTSTIFEFDTVEKPAGDYLYPRYGGPTRGILEKNIAALEEADYCLCFTSGLSAVFAVTHLLSPGDHIICSEVVYEGTSAQLRNVTSSKGLEISFVDIRDPQNVKASMKDNTKLVWLECPANPLLIICDIQAISNVVRKHPDAILAVDNTFLTPYFQKPLNYGADIVMHSATNYINGHGDVQMGAIATRKKDIYQKLKDMQQSLGFVSCTFDSYLVIRSLKTLHLRMREHMNNAMAVAKFLEDHPKVKKVLYPGLASHPQHELAKRQCQGFGGMVSFYIHGARKEAETFFHSLKLFTMTGSLGLPNSLACYPATDSHADVPKSERDRLGITENFIRLSVGLEAADDIIDDLKQALGKI